MTSSAEDITPIASTQSLLLDLPPSCVEFCPAFPSYFLIGTYDLQKGDVPASENKFWDGDNAPPSTGPTTTQSRNGSIVAFHLTDKTLTHVQTLPQPSALLDLHFNPNIGRQDMCAAVSSTATLAMFRFSPEADEGPPLKHLRTMDLTAMTGGNYELVSGSELLFLSFCWHPSKSDIIAISTSAGHVHLVDLGGAGGQWTLHTEPVLTHSLEAWCVAISPSLNPPDHAGGDVFTLLSGGDDSVLRYKTCTDRTTAEATQSNYTFDDFSPTIKRVHDAGVTAILPLGLKDDVSELVVTGSYDDHIRLFSLASGGWSGATKKLAESNLGGGVWRLKLISLSHDQTGDHSWRAAILVSCMHAGARVVELSENSSGAYEFRVLASFVEHKSMNYGSDFRTDQKGNLVVVSTSFYDKLLCLWEVCTA